MVVCISEICCLWPHTIEEEAQLWDHGVLFFSPTYWWECVSASSFGGGFCVFFLKLNWEGRQILLVTWLEAVLGLT